MPDGLNFDEMKRQQELVTLRATQNISKNQNMNYEPAKRKTGDLKQAVKAAAILLGVVLGVMLLLRAGIL
jgi:hypothetical protein